MSAPLAAEVPLLQVDRPDVTLEHVALGETSSTLKLNVAKYLQSCLKMLSTSNKGSLSTCKQGVDTDTPFVWCFGNSDTFPQDNVHPIFMDSHEVPMMMFLRRLVVIFSLIVFYLLLYLTPFIFC